LKLAPAVVALMGTLWGIIGSESGTGSLRSSTEDLKRRWVRPPHRRSGQQHNLDYLWLAFGYGLLLQQLQASSQRPGHRVCPVLFCQGRRRRSTGAIPRTSIVLSRSGWPMNLTCIVNAGFSSGGASSSSRRCSRRASVLVIGFCGEFASPLNRRPRIGPRRDGAWGIRCWPLPETASCLDPTSTGTAP